MTKLRPFISIAVGVLAAVVYGILARLAFGGDTTNGALGTLTIGFLCLVPLGLGALTVFSASTEQRLSWLYAAFMPLLACAIFVVLVAIFSWEAWICVIMASPILGVASIIGGTLMCLLFTLKDRLGGPQVNAILALLLLAPYFLTPLENRFPAPDLIRRLESTIEVNADAATVWRNIIRLLPISESEHPFGLFHLAGLPRPREAMLTHAGLGGARYGQWEQGLAFVGTITDWKPDSGFTVRLTADTHAVQASPLPLKEIGGPHFDILDDTYTIESLPNGTVRLHLFSTYRLTTRFNAYGSLWTDFFLRDIQRHILQIVKGRAEAGQ